MHTDKSSVRMVSLRPPPPLPLSPPPPSPAAPPAPVRVVPVGRGDERTAKRRRSVSGMEVRHVRGGHGEGGRGVGGAALGDHEVAGVALAAGGVSESEPLRQDVHQLPLVGGELAGEDEVLLLRIQELLESLLDHATAQLLPRRGPQPRAVQRRLRHVPRAPQLLGGPGPAGALQQLQSAVLPHPSRPRPLLSPRNLGAGHDLLRARVPLGPGEVSDHFLAVEHGLDRAERRLLLGARLGGSVPDGDGDGLYLHAEGGRLRGGQGGRGLVEDAGVPVPLREVDQEGGGVAGHVLRLPPGGHGHVLTQLLEVQREHVRDGALRWRGRAHRAQGPLLGQEPPLGD